MHYVLRAVSAAALLALPAAAPPEESSASVDIRWDEPTRILLGPEGELHPGERLTLRAEGLVCRSHTHEVKRKGWAFWKKKVTIDHDNWHRPDQLPPHLSLVDVETGTVLRADIAVSPANQTLEIPEGNAGIRTQVRPKAFVANVGESERGTSHGAFTLRTSVDSRGRVALLRTALAGRRYSPEEIRHPHFFDARTRRQYPDELAGLILQHIQRYYSNPAAHGDAVAALYREAVALDPGNRDALVGLGAELLRTGQYNQAGSVLLNGATAARRRATESPTQPNLRAVGDAVSLLAQFYEERNQGLTDRDLENANVLLSEAAQAYERGGETISLRNVLIRQARVLTRIRTVEALDAAVQALDRARRLSPIVTSQ